MHVNLCKLIYIHKSSYKQCVSDLAVRTYVSMHACEFMLAEFMLAMHACEFMLAHIHTQIFKSCYEHGLAAP